MAALLATAGAPRVAHAQLEAGSIRLALFAGYSFSDLNEWLVGVSGDLVVLPGWTATVAASAVLGVSGSLSQYEVGMRRSLATGSVEPYVGAGPVLFRSATGNGATVRSDVGGFGLAGIQVRFTRLMSFVEVLALKDGAVSGQLRGGVRWRLR